VPRLPRDVSGRLTHGVEAKLLAVYAFLVAMPLFVDLKEHSFTLVNLLSRANMDAVVTSGSTRIHLAFPVTVLFAALGALRARHVIFRRWAPLVVMALGLWFTLSALYGITDGGRLTDVVFYSQTVVPLLAWFVGYTLAVPEAWVARGIMAAYCVTDVIVLGFTLTHGGFGSAFDSSTQLENAIPQYRSYFPAVMALAVCLAIAHVGRRTWLPIATLVLAEVTLPLMWSRGGILMVVIAAVVTAACRFAPVLSLRGKALATAAGGTLLAIDAFITLTFGLVAQRTQESDLGASDSNRVQLARGAADRVGRNPFFGDAFHPYSSTLAGGRQASFSRIFPAHNQYLDYGLRGGVPAVLLLLAFLLLMLVAAGRIVRARPTVIGPAGWAGFGFVIALGFGSLTELYISQTWTGSLALLYLGVLGRCAVSIPTAAGDPEPVTAGEDQPTRGVARQSRG
jgi:O-Antigen ligase